ncbi:Eco57I restriction-modification methylase domain-containing protein [Helicobacter muridarum]|uniref:site-specific DNA-methyltransferase (adenine-specific) n=1 Tax=Helicobacter muridarum TaxID=216 RepID=A0A377PVA3_9HELI|nr:GIY-YIG nuclease family protein [Helicobacter muridarum]STQ86898.1 restriction /modification enzyme [Helicobacter muridarum]
MQNFPFLTNNLFTTYTLEVDFPHIYAFDKNKQKAQAALDSIKALYDKAKFLKQNEHQFEDDFIAKVLEILGWHSIRQDEKIIQGKLEKPDFLLFSSKEAKEKYQNIPKEQRQATNAHISVILESKAYNVEVDNKKIKDNPHFQLLRYLSNLKLDFGFLTNGRIWRFYDNSKLSSQKVFYEINLETLIETNNTQGFNYFYHIFHANNFITKDTEKKNTITDILNKNNQAKIAIEDDLQSLIYGINGKDSLFEKIGSCIYAKNPNAKLEDIYQSSLYFIFRLLFIAYFEDKFDAILQSHSSFKKKVSLYTLLSRLKQEANEENESFVGIDELEGIFRIYNEGNPNLDMPIFNGGLFDEANAPLLKTPKIFNDRDLINILDSLFNYQGTDTQNTLFRRDYRTLSVAHLGTIYEGLLSYFFAIAEEEIFYLVYAPKKGKGKLDSIEGYFDSYDYAKIAKNHTIHRQDTYKKGQIYLKNTSNSRKSTASFYTPESITKFLVSSALKNKLNDNNILHFKILDNACGSGHFLVVALNQITQIVQNDFDSFPSLKVIYEKEKQTIQSNICEFIQNYQADESDILKRLLLKRVIFGVDLNPFSIELTKLSLWIDSFIFGTPLSFLEHHIKCGNALIGTSIDSFTKYFNDLQNKGGNLFVNNFLKEFGILSQVFVRLDSIKDSTEADIKESKRLYKDEIAPTLNRLNLYLNAFNVKSFLTLQEQKDLESALTQNTEQLENDRDYKAQRELIQTCAKKYGFFNYEIEFPEIRVNNEFYGFDAIIGNPPWDKTKFSDNDFFPQYQSNYRVLSNNGKKEVQENLLSKSYIKKEYEATKAFVSVQNEYYKAHFPLNVGSGDGNLFRFFVERNLSLLAPNASLNYVLPSALMLEEGSLALRKEILENKTLQYFYSFENREGIFNDVHRSYKFALMQVVNAKSKPKHTIKTMFYKTSIEEIYDKSNIIPLTLQNIKRLSPNQLALQEVRSQKDLEILQKCYAAFAPLDLKWLDFRNELHMTADKDLFIESTSKGLLSLYQGKMIHQFNANFGEAQYFLNIVDFDRRLRSKEIYRLKQDLGIDNKEYKRLLQSLLTTCDIMCHSELLGEESISLTQDQSENNAYVYILTNTTKTTLYIGVTSNLNKRIYEHKNKLADGFTKKYNCSFLVYFESFDSITQAIEREKYLKGKKRDFKEKLINTINPKWLDLYEYLFFPKYIQGKDSIPHRHSEGREATEESKKDTSHSFSMTQGKDSIPHRHSEGREATEESKKDTSHSFSMTQGKDSWLRLRHDKVENTHSNEVVSLSSNDKVESNSDSASLYCHFKSSPTTRHSEPTTRHFELTTRHSELTTRHSELTTRHFELTTRHSEPLGEESKDIQARDSSVVSLPQNNENINSSSASPTNDKTALEDSFIVYDRQFYRLGFRDIARDTDERTAIFSLLPKSVGCGNTLWSSVPKFYALENGKITYHKVSHLRICFALGIFNSLLVDFIVRGMAQIHLNKTYIGRIPLPQPSDKEILENATYLSIAKNALILQLYNDKAGHFKKLQEEFGISQNAIPTTSKLYNELKAKQDIAIAKLYGLDKEEFCFLLESFKVLQSKKPEYIALLKNSWE